MPYRRPHKTSARERLRRLIAAGFDLSSRRSSGAVVPACSRCLASYLHGLPTHEATCPKVVESRIPRVCFSAEEPKD